jgi:hypothetical protein
MLKSELRTNRECDIADLNKAILFTSHLSFDAMIRYIEENIFTITKLEMKPIGMIENDTKIYSLILYRGNTKKEFKMNVQKSDSERYVIKKIY